MVAEPDVPPADAALLAGASAGSGTPSAPRISMHLVIRSNGYSAPLEQPDYTA
jgi:hypothetical protein